MRTSWILGAVVVGMMSVACGESPTGENVDETSSEGDSAQTSSTPSRKGPPAAEEEPETLVATPAEDQTAYESPCKGGWFGCERQVRCTGTASGNESLVSLTYDTETRLVKAMTALAKRDDHKNNNDVAVSVKSATDADYAFVFRSAEILADGKSVSVPVPTDFRVPAGASVRIETKFGGEAGGSAIATCFLAL